MFGAYIYNIVFGLCEGKQIHGIFIIDYKIKVGIFFIYITNSLNFEYSVFVSDRFLFQCQK